MVGPIPLKLPARSTKPRTVGITNLVDDGNGVGALADALDLVHPFVDIVKLGWASSHITSRLTEKIELFRRYDIRTCFGGMMFELCYWQNQIDAYASRLRDLGVDLVEVSNGSLPIPEADKCRMVERFAKMGFTVLAEVGSKDVTVETPPEIWIQAIRDDLNAGAWKVITEGRADASAGIYRADGSIRVEIVEAILCSGIPTTELIIEAPHKKEMVFFIKRLGSDVNFGNIPLDQVLNLETLRLGLRGDTVQHFHLSNRGIE